MSNRRLTQIALWLFISAVSLFLLERLFILTSFFSNILLLFGLAWLISLILEPIVELMTRLRLPLSGTRMVLRITTLPRGLAVSIAYLGLLVLLVLLVLALVPPIGAQLTAVGNSLPQLVDETNRWITWGTEQLRRFGFQGDLTTLIPADSISQQVAGIGSSMVQQSLSFLGGAANVLFQIFLVILFSYYMTADGPRMVVNIRAALPKNLHHEFDSFYQMLVRAFGGFLRAQLLSAVIYTIANALVMVLFGLPGIALASLLAGIAAIIPLIGGLIALIPTVLVALFVQPDAAVPVLVVMLVFQQVLYNLLMPRMQGDALGLHPLLIFAALLMGGAVGGFWGALFGIPIAGAISAVAQYFYLRMGLHTTATPAPPAADTPPSTPEDAERTPAETRHA